METRAGLAESEKDWTGKESRGFRGQQTRLNFKERNIMEAVLSPYGRWGNINTDASLSPQRKTQRCP